MKQILKRIFYSLFRNFGYDIKLSNIKHSPIHFDELDKDFVNIFHTIKTRTALDRSQAYILYQLCKQSKYLNGDVSEIGVFRGGSAKLIVDTLKNSNKHIHLFDTFEGMPETNKKYDLHRKGEFSNTSLESVKDFINSNSASYYPGYFPKTADKITNKQFSLVHIDVDIYQSVKDCCEFFYNKTVKSGIMLFDDYGYPSCPGATKAVDEFFSNKPESPCYLPTGQNIVVKL